MTSGFEGLSKPVLYRLSYTGMAPTTGFEPVTNGLTVRCSTAELCRLVPFASGSSPEVRLDLPAYHRHICGVVLCRLCDCPHIPRTPLYSLYFRTVVSRLKMEEMGGFEPPVPVRAHSLSKRAP